MTPRNLITATIATLAILTATPTASNGATTECPNGTNMDANGTCQPWTPPTTCPNGTTPDANHACQPATPPRTCRNGYRLDANNKCRRTPRHNHHNHNANTPRR